MSIPIPDTVEIPNLYLCPITSEILRNPVIVCIEGHTFEEEAICLWRSSNHTTCPLCRTPLLPEFLINHSLEPLIKGFLERVKAGYTGYRALIPPIPVWTYKELLAMIR
jgi:hypothetical protein